MSRTKTHANIVDLDDLVRDVRPIIERLAIMLSCAEAYGGALCDLWLLVPAELSVYRAPRPAPLMRVSGEFVIPADNDEVSADRPVVTRARSNRRHYLIRAQLAASGRRGSSDASVQEPAQPFVQSLSHVAE